MQSTLCDPSSISLNRLNDPNIRMVKNADWDLEQHLLPGSCKMKSIIMDY